MVTQFESPQVQQSVQHWKESQQKSDSLKQWALALGVPAILLYVFRPSGMSVPLDSAAETPIESIYHMPAAPLAETSSLPPISPVLLVLILCIFLLVASRFFDRIPTTLFPASEQSAAATQFSTPRIVDVQPGEIGQYSRCEHSSTFHQPFMSSQSSTYPFQSQSSTLFPQPSQFNRQPTKYTPIPQAPEGMLSKHWTQHDAHSYNDTYRDFPEVVEMGSRLLEIVERSIVEALLQKLDQSNQMWESELSRVGLKLVTHDPTLRSGDRRNPSAVSVFDRFLPQPLATHQMAVDTWALRQNLEVYFVHPSFPRTCRGYVIQRLRDWRQRGLRSGYRCYEKDLTSGITDGHIIENLLVKMLDAHTDFSKKYLQTPSLGSSISSLFGTWGLGSQGTVFLKPIRTDTVEYEVQTADGARKLRPGDRNIFEAFALFFLLKGRDGDRSLLDFPQPIQQLAQTTRPW